MATRCIESELILLSTRSKRGNSFVKHLIALSVVLVFASSFVALAGCSGGATASSSNPSSTSASKSSVEKEKHYTSSYVIGVDQNDANKEVEYNEYLKSTADQASKFLAEVASNEGANDSTIENLSETLPDAADKGVINLSMNYDHIGGVMMKCGNDVDKKIIEVTNKYPDYYQMFDMYKTSEAQFIWEEVSAGNYVFRVEKRLEVDKNSKEKNQDTILSYSIGATSTDDGEIKINLNELLNLINAKSYMDNGYKYDIESGNWISIDKSGANSLSSNFVSPSIYVVFKMVDSEGNLINS